MLRRGLHRQEEAAVVVRMPVFGDVWADPFAVMSDESKSLETAEVECQTEAIERCDAYTTNVLQVDAETVTERSRVEPEESKVPDTIGDLCKIMGSELEKSNAPFFEYEPLESRGTREVVYKYALSCAMVGELQCVSVSWNATGAVICAAFGRKDVDGWCDDLGFLCGWSVFAKDFKPDAPNTIIEHGTCFTVVECHPVKPALVAAGAFDGEILVYDLNRGKEEPLLAITEIHDYFHKEPISALAWVETEEKDTHQLCSLSGDGRLMFWSLSWMDLKEGKLPQPLRGMVLKPPPSARTNVIRIGGTALSFVANQKIGKGGPLAVFVGSEGGRVLRYFATNTHENTPAKVGSKRWDRRALEILGHAPKEERAKLAKHVENYVKNEKQSQAAVVSAADVFASKPKPKYVFQNPNGPVAEFSRHVGPVTAIKCSPFHRHLLLSVGVDANAQIFSTLQTKPLLHLDRALAQAINKNKNREIDDDDQEDDRIREAALHAADWSKARPLVFAIAGHDGQVRLFDLANDQHTIPAADLTVPIAPSPNDTNKRKKIGRSPLLCLQFNPRQRDFIAAGDFDGNVHVWQLPWHLSNARKDENAKLGAFLDQRDS